MARSPHLNLAVPPAVANTTTVATLPGRALIGASGERGEVAGRVEVIFVPVVGCLVCFRDSLSSKVSRVELEDGVEARPIEIDDRSWVS